MLAEAVLLALILYVLKNFMTIAAIDLGGGT